MGRLSCGPTVNSSLRSGRMTLSPGPSPLPTAGRGEGSGQWLSVGCHWSHLQSLNTPGPRPQTNEPKSLRVGGNEPQQFSNVQISVRTSVSGEALETNSKRAGPKSLGCSQQQERCPQRQGPGDFRMKQAVAEASSRLRQEPKGYQAWGRGVTQRLLKCSWSWFLSGMGRKRMRQSFKEVYYS